MVEILKLFMSRGFLLDRGVLDLLGKKNEEEVVVIINRLIEDGVKERIVTLEHLGFLNEDKIKVEGEGVKLLSDIRFLSRKVEVRDFVQHFRARYEALRDRLSGKVENLSSLRRIGKNKGVYEIVVMITGKRVTKNKNLLIEVEDLTGRSVVLVNRDRRDLFNEAKGLMLDDVVGFRVSGSSDMLFVSDIVFPDVGLSEEKVGEVDEYIAFSGDFHVGSKNFLEGNVLKFVDWLNGNVGDKRQRGIARKVRYLVLTGDMIDGVGVYAGQDKGLDIRDIKGQYRKVGEILGKIRGDVEVVMCAGQHDAVWVGEPQRVVSERWAGDLYKMGNLKLVPNPSLIDIGGFKVLMYHGASINRFIDEMNEIRVEFGHRSPTRVVREMLKRGHLAPTHGIMDYVPTTLSSEVRRGLERFGEAAAPVVASEEVRDALVIDVVPDIIATGDQHRAEVNSYNNVLMVAGSCWQSVTPFEEKVGNVPEPCRVPLFNLKTREVKIVDFSDKEIKWEEGDGLSCDLGVKDV